jgi:hypothetical protein
LLSLQLTATEWPLEVDDVPVPLKATVAVEVDALLTSERLPFTVLEVVGVNCTLNEALFPAARVSGKVSPFTAKEEVMFACEIVTDATLAVSVTVCDAVLPTLTEPKFKELELTASVPAVVPVPPVPETVMFRAVLYVVPALSHAWMTTECAPLAKLRDVLIEAALVL